jgi:hypothetical protein
MEAAQLGKIIKNLRADLGQYSARIDEENEKIAVSTKAMENLRSGIANGKSSMQLHEAYIRGLNIFSNLLPDISTAKLCYQK